MDEVCRLCTSTADKCVKIISREGIYIKEKLDILFQNSILQQYSTLNIICLGCYDIVDKFYAFYTRVLENQSSFQKINVVSGIEVSPLDPVPKQSEQPQEKSQDVCGIPLSRTENANVPSEEVPLKIFDEATSQNDSGEKPHNSDKSKYKLAEDPLPEHLKVRLTKAKGDAQINEFVKLVCDLCPNENLHRSFKELLDHYQTVHNQRGYALCCDKKFYRKDRLMNHITNHINPEAFKCPDCGQNRKSKTLLRIHMKQHLPAEHRKYQCDKCPQRFVLKSQLTNHEASHVSDDQKKFVCDICDKAFALNFVLIKHKLTHNLEKNFICDICAKSFASKTNLQSHMAHHQSANTPRVQCPICQLWYKNADTLRTHLHRHRDRRRHICATCQKECTTRSALAAHVRYVHLKVQPFECSICQKQFRRRLELTEHQARHTGEILYKCEFCPKTFTSNSNFFAHRKSQHPAQFALVDKGNKLRNSELPVLAMETE